MNPRNQHIIIYPMTAIEVTNQTGIILDFNEEESKAVSGGYQGHSAFQYSCELMQGMLFLALSSLSYRSCHGRTSFFVFTQCAKIKSDRIATNVRANYGTPPIGTTSSTEYDTDESDIKTAELIDISEENVMQRWRISLTPMGYYITLDLT